MLLDDEKIIARIDSGNVRASIEALPDQVEVAWRDARKVRVPVGYKKADQIVVAGMGGSTLSADIVKSVYGGALRAPFSFVNGYHLPGSVGKSSVVILSSYSGTTEETLACLAEAKKRGAKVLGIASGGPLAAAFKRMKAPAYIFDPVFNPCNQPRLGEGYMTAGLLGLLSSFMKFGLDAADMKTLPHRLRWFSESWSTRIPTRHNPAKLMARALHGAIPVIVSAEHLAGNGHVLQNQIHESAKQFCVSFPLPELNHHLMEGLELPAAAKKLLSFVFLDSKSYSERLRLRVHATQKVLAKQKLGFNSWQAAEKTHLGQAFEALSFGSWVSFYMAMQNRTNPSNIPWVDFFKKTLARG
jgi:glucose/mannose-6-phosphate isomerase